MENLLEQIGLTPTESKVYLTLLDIGESKVGDILQKAKLNSGRIYDVLNSLKTKGLLSYVTKGNVKYFIASPPERVRDYIDEKIRKIEKDKQSFEKLLPKLTEKYKSLKSKTNVEVFFGTEGFRTAYSIFLKEAKKDKNLYIQGVVKKEKYDEELINLIQYHIYKKRNELKLNIKKLASEEARNETLFSEDKSKIKYLPFPNMTGIELLGDITIIELISQKPIITIMIRNKDIAEDLKKQFKFLWKVAKQ